MQKKPEIVVFAGPNGSGKSTVTKLAKIIEPYINADDIRKSEYFFWEHELWNIKKIEDLTGINLQGEHNEKRI